MLPKIIAILLCVITVAAGSTKKVWEEDFNGNFIDPSKFTFDIGTDVSNLGRLQYYTKRSENVRIENGSLIIEAHKEHYNGSEFTSARISTEGLMEFKYGILEARMKLPKQEKGLWTSFYTLGINIGKVSWPACGQIVILENGFVGDIAKNVNKVVRGTTHGGKTARDPGLKKIDFDLSEGFHDYKLIWTDSTIQFRLDDDLIYYESDIPSEAFRQPHYFLINLAVGGDWTGSTTPEQVNATFPAQLQIDYIRLYQNQEAGDELILGSAEREISLKSNLWWKKKQTVTYSIFNGQKNIREKKLHKIIVKAFKTWEKEISYSFKEEVEPDKSPDIEVSFKPIGDHGDGHPFNETTAAHGIQYKYVHFNYNLTWSINEAGNPYDNDTYDIYLFSLFSIGQMLGLKANHDIGSVMNSDYGEPKDSQGNYVEPKLSEKDIDDIRFLYGGPKQQKTFTVFEKELQRGNNKAFFLYDDNSCHKLNGFNNVTASINTNGQCIEFFEDLLCEEKSVIVKPGCTDGSCCNPDNFVTCKFNGLANSYRACKNSNINILKCISIIIVLLITGLFLGILIPWLIDACSAEKTVKHEHIALQASYTHLPTTDNKKILISQLNFGKIIGKGNSADVRHAYFYSDLLDKENFSDVAVKTIKIDVSISSIQKEIEIMAECNHKNILKFVGWLQEGSHTHIVTEFMHGGNLHSFLRNKQNSPTIGHMFAYIMQILDGMIYLCKNHIVHRDLAARNCLLDSTFETLKISDFGLSRRTDNNYEYVLRSNTVLPIRWLPLEVLEGRNFFSMKSDIWAFAVVVWELFQRGELPYKRMDQLEMINFLKSGQRLSKPSYCLEEIYDIMLNCWDCNPAKRPPFDQLQYLFNSILKRLQCNESQDSGYYETPVKFTNA